MIGQVLPPKKRKTVKSFDIVLIPSDGKQSKMFQKVRVDMLAVIVLVGLALILIVYTLILCNLPNRVKSFFMGSEASIVKQREIDSLSQKLTILSGYGDKLRLILSERNTAVDTSKSNFRTSEYEDEFTHSFVINPMSTKHKEKLKFDENTILPYFIQGSISRGFNPSISHYGMDVATEAYEPISAFADGTVLFADWSSRYGYVVIMEHGDLITFYKHCGKILVSYGESVKRGEVIALVGNTGTESQDVHLHFEIWQDGIPKDPSWFIHVNTLQN